MNLCEHSRNECGHVCLAIKRCILKLMFVHWYACYNQCSYQPSKCFVNVVGFSESPGIKANFLDFHLRFWILPVANVWLLPEQLKRRLTFTTPGYICMVLVRACMRACVCVCVVWERVCICVCAHVHPCVCEFKIVCLNYSIFTSLIFSTTTICRYRTD